MDWRGLFRSKHKLGVADLRLLEVSIAAAVVQTSNQYGRIYGWGEDKTPDFVMLGVAITALIFFIYWTVVRHKIYSVSAKVFYGLVFVSVDKITSLGICDFFYTRAYEIIAWAKGLRII